jgi:hypothetical protein
MVLPGAGIKNAKARGVGSPFKLHEYSSRPLVLCRAVSVPQLPVKATRQTLREPSSLT